MEIDFEDALVNEFENLNSTRFKVNFSKQHIFVCGGEVNATSDIPPSFRDRFIHFSVSRPDIHDSIILAESFKDYFKENTFSNLLDFEDEIANIASLVLIFLESPGALVELGMFCSRPSFYKKLLIVAPQEETEAEDSFIYLGPLEYIKKKDESSVVVYPWPDNEKFRYEPEYLTDLLGIVSMKLEDVSRQVTFQSQNSGHVALLIYEIIRLSYPILISEIELALCALELDVELSDIKRHLYLLSKLEMIKRYSYSSYTYYYPVFKTLKTINFGKDKNNKVCDALSIQMRINQSYILADNISARKRKAAKVKINEKLDEGE